MCNYIGHSYHFHCCVEGTIVNTSSGIGVPIELIQPNTKILGYNQEHNGIVPANVLRNEYTGEKECVELMFEDGRSIMCSSDHRVLTSTLEWKRADQLVVDLDCIVCGMEPVATHDQLISSHWHLQLTANITFTTFNQQSINCAMVFSRIVGYLLTDGCIPKLGQDGRVHRARLYMRHPYDAQQVVSEFQLMFGFNNLEAKDAPYISIDSHGLYVVFLPIWFTKALIKLDSCFEPGARIDREFQLPEFITDSDTPRVVVREFLAGMLGGGGISPSYNTIHDYVDCGGFIQSRTIQHGTSLSSGMQIVCDLLNLFGVNASLCGGLHTQTDNIKIVTQLISIHDAVKFTFSVGIRYCTYKALQYAGAAAFFRYRQSVIQQRLCAETIQLADMCGPGEPHGSPKQCPTVFKNSGLLKQQQMKEHKTTHQPNMLEAIELSKSGEKYVHGKSMVDADTILNYQTRSTLDSVRNMDNSEWLKATRIYNLLVNTSAEQALVVNLLQRIDGEVNVTDDDDDDPDISSNNRKPLYCHDRGAHALPTFNMRLITRKSIGIRRTYDLEVEAPINSFTANGMVVHNCITKWLRTRSTCPLDDDEWDFVQY